MRSWRKFFGASSEQNLSGWLSDRARERAEGRTGSERARRHHNAPKDRELPKGLQRPQPRSNTREGVGRVVKFFVVLLLPSCSLLFEPSIETIVDTDGGISTVLSDGSELPDVVSVIVDAGISDASPPDAEVPICDPFTELDCFVSTSELYQDTPGSVDECGFCTESSDCASGSYCGFVPLGPLVPICTRLCNASHPCDVGQCSGIGYMGYGFCGEPCEGLPE